MSRRRKRKANKAAVLESSSSNDDDEEYYIPVRIHGRAESKDGSGFRYLTEWQGYPARHQYTYEPPDRCGVANARAYDRLKAANPRKKVTYNIPADPYDEDDSAGSEDAVVESESSSSEASERRRASRNGRASVEDCDDSGDEDDLDIEIVAHGDRNDDSSEDPDTSSSGSSEEESADEDEDPLAAQTRMLPAHHNVRNAGKLRDVKPRVTMPEGMNHVPGKVYLPGELFDMFIPEEEIDLWVQYTNEYAEERNASAAIGRPWSPVTASELYLFLACICYMGIVRLPAVRMYWSSANLLPTHEPMRHIILKRFEQIKRYFKVASPEMERRAAEYVKANKDKRRWDPLPANVDSEYIDWTRKTNRLLQRILRTTRMLVYPGSNNAVDEMMVRFAGRTHHKYLARYKPITNGYKVIGICTEGGIIMTAQYVSPSVKGSKIRDLDPTSSIVYSQMVSLKQESEGDGEERKDMVLYMDNLYTKRTLLLALLDKNIAAAGTVRTGNHDPSIGPGDDVKEKDIAWGSVWGSSRDGILEIVWYDNAVVRMMSTHHTPDMIMKERRRPRPSTSARRKAILKIFGENAVRKLAVPMIAVDYNAHMGYVDMADQLRSYYGFLGRSSRNWLPQFIFALEVAIVNSYKVGKLLGGATEHLAFRMGLVEHFLAKGARLRENEVEEEKKVHVDDAKGEQVIVIRRKKRMVFSKHARKKPLPSQRLIGTDHYRKKMDLKQRQRCFLCRSRGLGAKAPQTTWCCSKCNVFLCCTKKRDCFTSYHTAKWRDRY